VISGPGNEALSAVPPAKTALEVITMLAYGSVRRAARNERAREAVGLDIQVDNMHVCRGPNGSIRSRKKSERKHG